MLAACGRVYESGSFFFGEDLACNLQGFALPSSAVRTFGATGPTAEDDYFRKHSNRTS